MLQNWLDRLSRKCHGRAIPQLMTWIVAGMAIVYLMDSFLLYPLRHRLSVDLMFSWPLICRGEIWRLFTFIFVPTSGSLLIVFLSLYFYWIIGTSLEHQWGTFKFNIYYLCGLIGAIISGILTGSATNHYLNMSLFFAFAILNPDFEILLFFILPIRMKWLALLDAALLLYSCVMDLFAGSFVGVAALAFSLVNVGLFFGGDLVRLVQDYKRRREWRNKWR